MARAGTLISTPFWEDADDRGQSARGQHRHGILDGLRGAYRLERVVDPLPSRDVSDLLAMRVTDRGGVHSMRRTEGDRPVELLRRSVDCDDGRGASDARGLDDRHPDAAAPDDGHAAAGGDAGRAEDGSGARHDRAAEQGGRNDGHQGGNRDQAALINERVFGEPADP